MWILKINIILGITDACRQKRKSLLQNLDKRLGTKQRVMDL